jgi:hypothetical protein
MSREHSGTDPADWTIDPWVWAAPTGTKGLPMLYTIFVVLVILWLLGIATSYTLNGFIHLLLLLAIAAILIRIIQGRKPI